MVVVVRSSSSNITGYCYLLLEPHCPIMFVWQCGVSLPNAWLRCLGGGAHRHRHTQHKNKHAHIDTAAILMPRQQQCLLLDLSSNPKHGKQESPGLGWTFLTAHFGTIPKPSAAKHESPEIQPDIPKARGPHQARPQLPCTSPQQEAVGSDPEAGAKFLRCFHHGHCTPTLPQKRHEADASFTIPLWNVLLVCAASIPGAQLGTRVGNVNLSISPRFQVKPEGLECSWTSSNRTSSVWGNSGR